MFATKAQQGEDIDISSLKFGLYNLHIQVGECETLRLFNILRQTEDIITPTTPTYATKLLRNSQILILRGNKTYTLTGQQVK